MPLRAGARLAVMLCAAAPVLASAQENKDLDFIPGAVQGSAPGQAPESGAPPRTPRGRYYLEDALTWSSLREGLVVPFPPPSPPRWQNRTSLDAFNQWDLGEHLTATVSDRFNVLEQSGVGFPSRQSFRNDFREGYVTWEPATRNYLETGRINVRNGVALGFNPTDFFKTRTLVDQASLDPSVIRQNRLGTLMARGQSIGDGGSAAIAWAPKFYSPAPISSNAQPSLDPQFDKTNAAGRLLLSANYDIADLSPQALVYHESGRTKFGLNLSRQIGQSVVAYAEWAGGKQPNFIAQALAYGKQTGTLPVNAPTLPPTDSAERFRNDLAIGASWSSAAKTTLNLEYHYHEAGFSRQDLKNWFALGGANADLPAVTGELWYIRGFANAQQQPLTRHQVFLRANWTDAFVSNLELGAFAFVNLYDGSSLTQISASYYLSDAWTVRGYATANVGSKRSERGSALQAGGAIFQLVRYF